MKAVYRLLLAFAAVLLVADAAALITIDRDDAAPKRWDRRLAPLATFVEDHRHLRYDHPVKAEFLSVADYEKITRTDEGELTAEDKQEIRTTEGQMRALGLLDKDASLFDDLNTITSGGTLAFYDDVTERIVVRGTKLTTGMRVTLVHELTHALQDQSFDLGRTFESDNKSTFFKALAEGDATRIENEYVAELGESDRNAYFDEQDESQGEAQDAIDNVAPALTQLFGAPYALGAPMTTVVVEAEGVAALDKLFRSPPASDEGLLDPFSLLDHAPAKKVATPKLGPGEKRVDANDFGAVTWYLMLASFIDEKVALDATDGWAGDRYVGYKKDGRDCIRMTFVGDTGQDNSEMQNALGQWRAAVKSPRVQVTPKADGVEVDACEPDTTPSPRAGSDQSLVLPAARFQIVQEVLKSGGSERFARCVSHEAISRIPVSQLNPQSEADFRRLESIGAQVGQLCSRRGET